MSKYDPFKLFLQIYGVLVLVGCLVLVGTKNEIHEWFIENSAYDLLATELSYIEDVWYEEGEEAAKVEIYKANSELFTYKLGETITDEELDAINEELSDDEYHLYIENKFDQILGEASQEHEYANMISYLTKEEGVQILYASLNLNYFDVIFSTFNALVVAVAAVLILGFVIALIMVRTIKSHLTKINKASENIYQTNNLYERVPVGNLTGPLADTINQINQMLSGVEKSVNATKQQANNIAHDLRTPITAMYNKVQRLANDYPELIEVEVMQEKLLATFNTLLRINRLESNGELIRMESTYVSDIINDAAEIYEPVFEERSQELRVKISGKPHGIVNNELLFQSVCNLLDNASKYTPANRIIELQATQTEQALLICVTDQGGGVRPENLEKLTQKFFREDVSRTAEGNGLGLSFVTAAVKKMNGDIEFENTHLESLPGLTVKLKLKS